MLSRSMRCALVASTALPSRLSTPARSNESWIAVEGPPTPLAALGICTGTFLALCTVAVTMKMMSSTSMMSTRGTMLMATMPPLREPPTSPAMRAPGLGGLRPQDFPGARRRVETRGSLRVGAARGAVHARGEDEMAQFARLAHHLLNAVAEQVVEHHGGDRDGEAERGGHEGFRDGGHHVQLRVGAAVAEMGEGVEDAEHR